MDKVLIILLMVMCILASISKESLMDLDSISGLMAVCILESSGMALKQARASGGSKRILKHATTTKALTITTRRVDLVNLLGKVAMFTEDATRMMRDMDTERCTGLMVHATRVSGSTESKMVWEGWSLPMVVLKKVYLRTMFTRDHP